MTAQEAEATVPAAAQRSWRLSRSWRLPRSWRERVDWVPADTALGQVLRGTRWAAIGLYVFVLSENWYTHGVPFGRSDLLLWIAIGLGVACIGRHPVWLLWVAIDFVPFAAVLVAYDYLRGWSDTVGMPTWWSPQINVDKFLFFGTEPTVWLQEHLKYPDVQWYDIVVCVCYYSFFLLPYVTAGAMWLRSRADFYRWSLRFVSLSFFAFSMFLLTPAAPPWAAARCTATQVASHPNNPVCMHQPAQFTPGGGLLGPFATHQPGANPWVEQIASRGFVKLHLGVADTLLSEGRVLADPVAAVPSLHLGGTVLFCIFMWRRVNKWWRPLLVGYPLLMTFSLAYAGEHFVADCIAGALAAWLIHVLANRVERRRKSRRGPDTLGTPPDLTLETPCPPTHPLPATTPSST